MAASRDASTALPDHVEVWFPAANCAACSGAATPPPHPWYKVSVPIADAGLDGSPSGFPGSLVVHDSAVARYSGCDDSSGSGTGSGPGGTTTCNYCPDAAHPNYDLTNCQCCDLDPSDPAASCVAVGEPPPGCAPCSPGSTTYSKCSGCPDGYYLDIAIASPTKGACVSSTDPTKTLPPGAIDPTCGQVCPCSACPDGYESLGPDTGALGCFWVCAKTGAPGTPGDVQFVPCDPGAPDISSCNGGCPGTPPGGGGGGGGGGNGIPDVDPCTGCPQGWIQDFVNGTCNEPGDSGRTVPPAPLASNCRPTCTACGNNFISFGVASSANGCYLLCARTDASGAGGLFKLEAFNCALLPEIQALPGCGGGGGRGSSLSGARAEDSGPDNAAELKALASRIAKDAYGWLLRSFDEVFAGIVDYQGDGLTDWVQYRITADEAWTRASSSPLLIAPDEMNHAGADCAGSKVTECDEPAVKQGKKTCMTRYEIKLQDGALQRTKVGTGCCVSTCCSSGSTSDQHSCCDGIVMQCDPKCSRPGVMPKTISVSCIEHTMGVPPPACQECADQTSSAAVTLRWSGGCEYDGAAGKAAYVYLWNGSYWELHVHGPCASGLYRSGTSGTGLCCDHGNECSYVSHDQCDSIPLTYAIDVSGKCPCFVCHDSAGNPVPNPPPGGGDGGGATGVPGSVPPGTSIPCNASSAGGGAHGCGVVQGGDGHSYCCCVGNEQVGVPSPPAGCIDCGPTLVNPHCAGTNVIVGSNCPPGFVYVPATSNCCIQDPTSGSIQCNYCPAPC